MTIHPGPARRIFLAITGCLRGLLDRLRGERRGLDGRQRAFLSLGFQAEREALVEDAETRGISDGGARRLALIRAVVRWLARGELPGPEAVPCLERLLAGIQRNPSDYELTERRALVAAIHDLGGDDEAAAELWMEADAEGLAVFGRCFHLFMRQAGLTVAEVAGRAEIERSAVVAFLTGAEEPRTSETLRLAGAVGVPGYVLFDALAAERVADEPPGESERPVVPLGMRLSARRQESHGGVLDGDVVKGGSPRISE